MGDSQLEQIVSKHKMESVCPVLKDFYTYLKYLLENDLVVQQDEMNLPSKDIKIINLTMSPPEKPKEALDFEPFPRLKLFYILCLMLDLVDLDNNSKLLVKEKRVEEFFSLLPIQQYCLLFQSFWNNISWACLSDQEDDWDERYAYLSIFSCVAPEEDIYLQGDNESLRLEGKRLKKIWPTCGPFLAVVLPNLRNFRLLDYSLEHNNYGCEVKSILVTNFGKDVFSHLFDEMKNNPTHLLKEAWERIAEGDLLEAKNLIQIIREKNNSHPDVYNLMGAICLEEENYQQALTNYRAARNLSRFWMGLNYRESFSFQNWEKRITYLKAQLGLALSYRGLGNWILATEILKDMLELDEEDPLGVKFLLRDVERKL